MFSERKRTPMPNQDIEMKSTGSGAVTTYQMSPEELAKYGPANPVKHKPAYVPVQPVMTSEEQSRRAKLRYQKELPIEPTPHEEEVTMSVQPISREEYLIRRSKGEKRTAIFDSLGLNTTQYYKLLTEWGIKDSKVEQRYIDLIPARKDVPAETIVEEPTGVEGRGLVKVDEDSVEFVESISKSEEVERLRDELHNVTTQRNRENVQSVNLKEMAKVELEKWANKYDLLSAQFEDLSQERDNYKQAIEDLEAKIDKQKALAARPVVQLEAVPTPQNMRQFHVDTKGSGGKVGGDLEALMKYVRCFNNEFRLEVSLNEIAPVDAIQTS